MTKRTNEEWLAALRGSERDRAIGDLRAVIVRGLKVTFSGRVRGLDEAAEDLAQDALIRILNNLGSFRGREPLHHLGAEDRRPGCIHGVEAPALARRVVAGDHRAPRRRPRARRAY